MLSFPTEIEYLGFCTSIDRFFQCDDDGKLRKTRPSRLSTLIRDESLCYSISLIVSVALWIWRMIVQGICSKSKFESIDVFMENVALFHWKLLPKQFVCQRWRSLQGRSTIVWSCVCVWVDGWKITSNDSPSFCSPFASRLHIFTSSHLHIGWVFSQIIINFIYKQFETSTHTHIYFSKCIVNLYTTQSEQIQWVRIIFQFSTIFPMLFWGVFDICNWFFFGFIFFFFFCSKRMMNPHWMFDCAASECQELLLESVDWKEKEREDGGERGNEEENTPHID